MYRKFLAISLQLGDTKFLSLRLTAEQLMDANAPTEPLPEVTPDVLASLQNRAHQTPIFVQLAPGSVFTYDSNPELTVVNVPEGDGFTILEGNFGAKALYQMAPKMAVTVLVPLVDDVAAFGRMLGSRVTTDTEPLSVPAGVRALGPGASPSEIFEQIHALSDPAYIQRVGEGKEEYNTTQIYYAIEGLLQDLRQHGIG